MRTLRDIDEVATLITTPGASRHGNYSLSHGNGVGAGFSRARERHCINMRQRPLSRPATGAFYTLRVPFRKQARRASTV